MELASLSGGGVDPHIEGASVSEVGGNSPGRTLDAESDEVLRAKYLDYCSAQLAEILLYLTPDEIFVLAREAARERDMEQELSYAEAVALATGKVSQKVALPPYEVWLEDYRRYPDRYEQYLMGLWRSDLEE